MNKNPFHVAGTFTQLYIQAVFAVKHRECLIPREFQEELNKYIAGILRAKNNKPININGMPDHIHVFFGLRPVDSISSLIRDVKNNSTNFINEKQITKKKFRWQEGYGAFSYSQSAVNNVYNYIANQEQHHTNKTFKAEYLQLLDEFEVGYDAKYLFDWLD